MKLIPKIRERRMEKHMTQIELAKKIGYITLSVENKKRDVKNHLSL